MKENPYRRVKGNTELVVNLMFYIEDISYTHFFQSPGK